MKKQHRNAETAKLTPKLCGDAVKNLNNVEKNVMKRSFCNLSVHLFFSFWCAATLFHAKFGVTRGNEWNLLGSNRSMQNSKLHDENSLNYSTAVGENEFEAISTEAVMELKVPVVINDSVPRDLEKSSRETSAVEDLISAVLGFEPFMCHIQLHEQGGEMKTQLPQNGRIQLTYPNLDEFKYISSQEKSGIPHELVNITHRLEPDGTPYNYASSLKGAKVVGHNKEAKGASNVLGKDHDKYLRNPCSAGGKYFIIELGDETLVDAVKMANYEHHSSNFKDFELMGSLEYPTETWSTLGKFVAANVKQTQCFKLPEPIWVRYLRVNLLSHYGSEFYCTISVVEAYGVDAVEQMLEDLIVTSGGSSTKELPNPNSTEKTLTVPDKDSKNPEKVDVSKKLISPESKVVKSVDEGEKLTSNTPKKAVPVNSMPDSAPKAKQHSNNRLHADAALKVVLQKVRLLELNLAMLEEYIKEVNKRGGDFLPEIDKELSKFSSLLEKSKLEMKNLLEWKEIMEKGIFQLESWKAAMSTQLELLTAQNSMLRSELEKLSHDQESLENKELAVLMLCFFFAIIAILNLIAGRVVRYFMVFPLSTGWTLILIFCISTMLIPLFYG